MRSIYKEITIILIFVFITCVYFWPVITHFNSYLPGDYDELFITWSIIRMARDFPQNPEILFDGGIFYPHQFTQGFSDLFITSGLIAKPFLYFLNDPVAAFNANLIFGQILMLWFTYLMLNKILKDKLVSIGMSLVFNFSLIHLHYIPHLHTFCVYLVPLSGWILLQWIQTKKPAYIYAFCGVVILQALNSPLPVYFMGLLTIVLLTMYKVKFTNLWNDRLHILLAFIASFIVAFPFGRVYFLISNIHQYKRPITEVIHFSLSPEELITKFGSSILYGLFLTSISIVLFRKIKDRNITVLFTGAAMSFLLSLGPVLHWMGKTVKIPYHIPLPYAVLYYLLPGFNGFRTPSRWLLLMALFMVMLSGYIIHTYLNRNNKHILLGLVLVLIIFLVPQYPRYVAIPRLDQAPSIYHWLKYQPETVIIELPMAAWDKGRQTQEEIYRMYWSLYHGKKLVNGYSGFFPHSYLELTSLIQQQFPNNVSISALQKSGAQLLLLHLDQYGERRDGIQQEVEKEMGKPDFTNGQVWVYRLQETQ